jgi:hypothetical protein
VQSQTTKNLHENTKDKKLVTRLAAATTTTTTTTTTKLSPSTMINHQPSNHKTSHSIPLLFAL